MSKETLYSAADKERLLQELEVLTTTGTRVPVIKDDEHVEALHDLFGQVVGISKEVEEAPVPKEKGPKMTHQQLAAMKGVTASSKTKTPGAGGLKPIFQAAIQCWCAITGFFTDRKTKGAEACEKKRASKDPKTRK